MGESSPDLSLRLRRGSSDSRDSFYMDFAQGIDSDIEEVARPGDNCDSLLENQLDENGCDLPLLEDITTIPEEASEELREEEEAAALEAASRTTDVPVISMEMEKSSIGSTMTTTSTSMTTTTATTTTTTITTTMTITMTMTTTTTNTMMITMTSTTTVMTTTTSPSTGVGTFLTAAAAAAAAAGTATRQDWPGLPAALPSPASPSAVIVSPETLSRHSSSSPSRAHRSPQYALALPCSSQPIPTVCYPAPTFLEVADDRKWKNLGCDALATTLSALYGKLLVVMGIAFPMAEVISTYIPPSFYEAFYLYLYFGSMIFLMYMYGMLLRDGKPKPKKQKDVCDLDSSRSSSGAGGDSDAPDTGCPHMTVIRPIQHYGSFYLRMGAVAFGIGSMIYSGLEFGQYFELERNTKCHNIMLALTPATRMAFIFIQMYFIFLNNEQMKVHRHRIVARFGLMHMIGTNLSVWLNVLVQETKHEILTFYNPENNSLRISHRLGMKGGFHLGGHSHVHHGEHLRVPRGLKGPHHMFECRRTNIMGSLVQDASPFLFPCTIEYSLICAAILYVMWKNISKTMFAKTMTPPGSRHHAHAYRRSPHHYSVDCARAHKGLFVGIFILVLTIISLILFFVLISRPELVSLAVTEVNICELTLYGMSTLGTLIGMFQMRKLRYDGGRNLELDNILLVAAQTGMFIYSTFTIIGGHFTLQKHTVLVLVTALASVVQTTCQTIFILDASRRSVATAKQIRRKPGREIVTFLLVTNLAMWAINTLEKSRAESHPVQLHFYGLWAWTIITHVSMPLAIFYRFHSTVCLCEVWKRAYKVKPTYM
ncbi:proton channel OtopLc-like isoform X2 [Vespula pensylvanica]|uniref:proton channel OtopLc-like isoform X2 n=1 Tax=Vespula pensylvanica TaxID=30213 RepID=UPI001CBA341D|nr:proton channel OtopLc-like isoform X2 [Vespula pensylvanica]XP_050850456.1 proton channel OtopLc-like isoform X3 [Vespula vulgaris]